MAEYEKKVRKILKANGWDFLRQGKGNHEMWANPLFSHKLTVDGKIKSRHSANGIMKSANIKHKF